VQVSPQLYYATVTPFAYTSSWKLRIGVVGLTTAVRLQEQGKYDVTIIAEVFPEDPKTIKYTSQWAVGFDYRYPTMHRLMKTLTRVPTTS
jgi:hypothetical protein